MKKVKLYYAEKDKDLLEEDITLFEYESFNKMLTSLHNTFEYKDETVYLLSYQRDNENINTPILIEEDIEYILTFLESLKNYNVVRIQDNEGISDSKYFNVFFLQEYESYESAYAVALHNREATSHLTYDNTPKRSKEN